MRLFVARDLDGFFGLFVDNLVQLFLIIALCAGLCGMTGEHQGLLYHVILPGAAISILLGNLFYAIQAHLLAYREGRDDVTALPYGINTPSLLVFIFFVMAPAYAQTQDPVFAWRMGLIACLGSGIIEFLGAFVAEPVRRNTPRAALLSTLAGIAIGFISMKFMLEIFTRPLVAMMPLGIVLITYFSRTKMPIGIPGGLLAIVVGTATAWLLPTWLTGAHVSWAAVQASLPDSGWRLPIWCGPDIAAALGLDADWRNNARDWLGFLSVIIPMGLFNVIGSLQNIESAEASGDRYHTGLSLGANGIGTITAALLGSCFPTTIYIGHPGWKALGARAGYSTLNGIVIVLLCLSGLLEVANQLIPLDAGIAIVLWIGIIITAQAFQTTPKEHAPAVAIGLFPAIAAWGATVVFGAFAISGGKTMQDVIAPIALVRTESEGESGPDRSTSPKESQLVDDSSEKPEENRPTASDQESPAGDENTSPNRVDDDSAPQEERSINPTLSQSQPVEVNGYLLHGLLVVERGYIFICMILAAISAALVDRRFMAAAFWALIGAGLTLLGLCHAYQLHGNVVDFFLIGTQPAAGTLAYPALDIAIGYALLAVVFVLFSRSASIEPAPSGPKPEEPADG